MVRKRERKRERERGKQSQRHMFRLAIVEEVSRSGSSREPPTTSICNISSQDLSLLLSKAYALEATFSLPIAQCENSLHLAVGVELFPIEGFFLYLYLDIYM